MADESASLLEAFRMGSSSPIGSSPPSISESPRKRIRGLEAGESSNPDNKRRRDTYSTNAHSVKSRTRKELMTEGELEIEKAKDADRQALSRAKRAFKKTEAYLNASDAAKEKLLGECEKDLMKDRFQKGISAAAVKERDADNWVWETFDGDDPDAEIYTRLDEIDNQEHTSAFLKTYEKHRQGNKGKNDEEVIQSAFGMDKDELRMRDRIMSYHRWKLYWLDRCAEYEHILRLLGKRKNYDAIPNEVIHLAKRPGVVGYFRNIRAWGCADHPDSAARDCDTDCDKVEENEWYELPGPAWCYIEGLDYAHYGLDVNMGEKDRAFRAWAMLFEQEIPDDFDDVLWSESKLMMKSTWDIPMKG